MHPLLRAVRPPTKVVEEIHRLRDAFGAAGTYTCSILIVITATLLLAMRQLHCVSAVMQGSISSQEGEAGVSLIADLSDEQCTITVVEGSASYCTIPLLPLAPSETGWGRQTGISLE